MNSNKIRTCFLNFFQNKGHKIKTSLPVVIKNDPTLMFVNAGMNQFKDIFLGDKTSNYKRIVNFQKCLRVSGKHNDLEEVGHDTYHHTMFEMLGNWSFDDYFKKEAIEWAWELLTKVYKLKEENLYVTIFAGDSQDNLPLDKRVFEIWSEILPKEKIINGSKQDNFWEMGTQGPCGPSTEIHIDLRSNEDKTKNSARKLINTDHSEVIEIWNIVFIQYNRLKNNKLVKLEKAYIDTGMGFERLCMVIQNKTSTYDTDIFESLITKLETISKIKYKTDENTDAAFRVIVDHIRAVVMTIADGQLPSNNGQGYVIRRILRRAIRYYFSFLAIKQPVLYQLVDVVANYFKGVYDEIGKQKEFIKNVIREEEFAFLKTIEKGLKLLDKLIQFNEVGVISGEKVFELYDTYGFPTDLTNVILKENGLSYNHLEFEKNLNKQKNRSKKNNQLEKDDWHIIVNTNDSLKFLGYDSLSITSKIVKYRKVEDKKYGKHFHVVFQETPFYAENGGQVGDSGEMIDSQNNKFKILDTKKENNIHIHIFKTLPKDKSQVFFLLVDKNKRRQISCNHSATHLLHQALRDVLGSHVEQRGSMVNASNLRFDFSHFSKLTENELTSVENIVNNQINAAIELEEKRNENYQEALKNNVLALFGEKYSDKVRTIKFGKSYELCGGTHIENTIKIWNFNIISESAVASGIRRIEAVTSDKSREYLNEFRLVSKNISILLNDSKVFQKVSQLKLENENLKKEVSKLKKYKIKQIQESVQSQMKELNGIKFLSTIVDCDAESCKKIMFNIGQNLENTFLLIGTSANNKVALLCYISKQLVINNGYDAKKVITSLSKYIKGGGGGQDFFAMAGGNDKSGLQVAVSKAKDFLQ